VTEITHDPSTHPYPYTLHTPRGPVRAAKIVHATNGHAGHLLPALRGTIFPLRGTMSTQKATCEFGRQGHNLAWSLINSGGFDGATNTLEPGLYYSCQNPVTGDIFVGGERGSIDGLLVSDDSTLDERSKENLTTVFPRLLTKGWDDGAKSEAIRTWSGIMGFTVDRLPLVGRLPGWITRRGEEGSKSGGEGEYIAAGFNGYGMPLCWSSGEAVAKMVLGVDADEYDFLPEVFRADEERLRRCEKMVEVSALQMLFGGRH
jgi:glycine/D-amino acid oxidase-like deaminating enzyme